MGLLSLPRTFTSRVTMAPCLPASEPLVSRSDVGRSAQLCRAPSLRLASHHQTALSWSSPQHDLVSGVIYAGVWTVILMNRLTFACLSATGTPFGRLTSHDVHFHGASGTRSQPHFAGDNPATPRGIHIASPEPGIEDSARRRGTLFLSLRPLLAGGAVDMAQSDHVDEGMAIAQEHHTDT